MIAFLVFVEEKSLKTYEEEFNEYPIGKYADSEEFFALENVKPGMVGYGKTVLKGKEISIFKVEVVDIILHPLYAQGKAILTKIYFDHPYGRSNVLAGMSGSPVYFLDKILKRWQLAGCLAFSYGRVPTVDAPSLVGITPISFMADQLSGVGLQRAAERKSGSGFEPLAIPLTVVGAGGNAFEMLIKDSLFRSFNFVFLPASASESGVFSHNGLLAEPEPGSSVSVALVEGPINIFGTGTVTYVDRKRFLAFGHPFLRSGKTKMLAYESTIITPLMLSKLPGNLGKPIGTIVYDNVFAIEGERKIDSTAMLPVHLRVRIVDSSYTNEVNYDFRVVRNRLYAGLLVNLSTQLLLENVWPSSKIGTAVLKTSVRVKDRKEPLNFYSTGVLNQVTQTFGPISFFSNVWLGIFQKFNTAFQNLLSSSWGIEVEEITMDLSIKDGVKAMIIDEAVILDKADGSGKATEEVKPGQLIYLRMIIRDFEGRKNYVNFLPIRIPSKFNFVTSEQAVRFHYFNLYIQSGKNFSEKDVLKIPHHLPTSREEFLERLQSAERDPSKIYVQLVLPEEYFDSRGEQERIVASEFGSWQPLARPRKNGANQPTVQRVIIRELSTPLKDHVIDFEKNFTLKLILPAKGK